MIEQLRDIESLLSQRAPVERAMLDAAHDVVRLHRESGLPLALWRDGQLAWVAAHDVALPEDHGNGHRTDDDES